MKTFLKTLLVVSACAMLLASCGVSSTVAQTEGVSLSHANFHYVQSVSAKAVGGYFLGCIGGLGKNARAEAAIKNLKEQYPLGPNQAYTNFNVSETYNYYVFWANLITTVSADIVEFDKPDCCKK